MRAGLRDDIGLPAAVASELGVVRGGLNLELLNRFRSQADGWNRDRNIVVIRAVNAEVIVTGALAPLTLMPLEPGARKALGDRTARLLMSRPAEGGRSTARRASNVAPMVGELQLSATALSVLAVTASDCSPTSSVTLSPVSTAEDTRRSVYSVVLKPSFSPTIR